MSGNDKRRRPSAFQRFIGFCVALVALITGSGIYVGVVVAAAAFGAMHGLFGFENGPHDLLSLRIYSGVGGAVFGLIIFLAAARSWLPEGRFMTVLVCLVMPVAFTAGLWLCAPTYSSEPAVSATVFMQGVHSASEMSSLWSAFRGASLLPAWIVILLTALTTLFWPQPAHKVAQARQSTGAGLPSSTGLSGAELQARLRARAAGPGEQPVTVANGETEHGWYEDSDPAGPPVDSTPPRRAQPAGAMSGEDLLRRMAQQQAAARSTEPEPLPPAQERAFCAEDSPTDEEPRVQGRGCATVVTVDHGSDATAPRQAPPAVRGRPTVQSRYSRDRRPPPPPPPKTRWDKDDD